MCWSHVVSALHISFDPSHHLFFIPKLFFTYRHLIMGSYEFWFCAHMLVLPDVCWGTPTFKSGPQDLLGWRPISLSMMAHLFSDSGGTHSSSYLHLPGINCHSCFSGLLESALSQWWLSLCVIWTERPLLDVLRLGVELDKLKSTLEPDMLFLCMMPSHFSCQYCQLCVTLYAVPGNNNFP